MSGRRDMRTTSHSLRKSRVGIAIAIGVTFGCLFALFLPHGLVSFYFYSAPILTRTISESNAQAGSASCESSERINMLKSDLVEELEINSELERQIKELTEKLRLADQRKDHAQKQVLVLGKQQKAGPFGTVKGLRTNPALIPDESVNPRLAKILEKVAVQRELIVAVANSNVKEMLEVWFTNIKKVGIPNYLVVALDEDIAKFCESKDVPVYKRDPDEGIDSIARTGGNHAVSGILFIIFIEIQTSSP
uniref:Uncharacterized protein n=1 Tax=Fagus sylvatica TaxID=28930 RepID=A0A2N9G0C0_FAGSY